MTPIEYSLSAPTYSPMPVIYIAVSRYDLRFARICIASIRHFHPQATIKILAGSPLPRKFIHEVQHHWGVTMHPLPVGDYGWGFVKLEPLFGDTTENFLVLDADTVLTGPVLRNLEDRFAAPDNPQFIVDKEDQPEAEVHRLYYDWKRVSTVDPTSSRPAFVFNSGQWAGRSGVLKRSDFDSWLEWTFPRRLKHPDLFMPGDQGVLNYVLNRKVAFDAIPVALIPLMKWPGDGMSGFEPEAINSGVAPVRVVHWAGMKKPRLSSMSGGDLLAHFERAYYSHLPNARYLRHARAAADTYHTLLRRFRTRASLFWKSKIQQLKL
jgi:hypothetical protein